MDTCAARPIRVLTVSRIDPRKGLRVLPEAIAQLAHAGHDVTLDIVGPTIGQIGDEERAAIVADAERRGVASRIRLLGAIPLDRLMATYREYDLFVLPTRPGEGIPRVLMEAMAAGASGRDDRRGWHWIAGGPREERPVDRRQHGFRGCGGGRAPGRTTARSGSS